MPRDYDFQGERSFDIHRERRTKFVPTLFIGLGGTGKDVLLRFRRKLYDEYGVPNEQFARFLAIDTDGQPYTPTEGKPHVYAPVSFRTEDNEQVICTVPPNQFHQILEDIRQLPDRRYVNWLHPHIGESIKAAAFANGAGTYRQGGRLAFFRNYTAIRNAIRRHFTDMMAYAATHPKSVFDGRPGEVDNESLEVVIITSLAGGTGAGMFIDVAYLVRDILDYDPNFNYLKQRHSTVIAVLPEVFAKRQQALAKRFYQNAYAALMEMEYYNTPRVEENPFESEQPKAGQRESRMVEFVVNWEDPRAVERPIRTHAWDTCYLIDDVNPQRPGSPLGQAGVCQMIADYLYWDFGTTPFAVAKRSARPNNLQLQNNFSKAVVYDTTQGPDETAEPGSDVFFENKYGCTFSSFGIAEVFIDKNRINRCAAYRLARRLVQDVWIGDPSRHPETFFRQQTARDLTSGEPPPGKTKAISFHPNDLRKELLREPPQTDWLGQLQRDFEQLAKGNATEGLARLQAVLARHRDYLSASVSGGGSTGAARRTMEARLARLRGSAADPGELRTRLRDLMRHNLNKFGVMTSLGLIEEYRRAFAGAARRAREDAKKKGQNEQDLLARLREADQVPFPCRKLALRAEYAGACTNARAAAEEWYTIASGEYLENLNLTLSAFVGAEDQPPSPSMPETLHSEYAGLRKFLNLLVHRLDERFEDLQAVTESDRNRSLVEWDQAKYDTEIDAALLADKEIHPPGMGAAAGSDRVLWDNVQAALLAVFAGDWQRPVSLADLLETWSQQYQKQTESLPEIAEQLARACQRVLKKGVSFKEYADGNVVDFLFSNRCPKPLDEYLGALVDGAAPYLPRVNDTRSAYYPVIQVVLGRTGSDEAGSEHRVDQITRKVIDAVETKYKQSTETIAPRWEAGPPTSLLLVCELGGIPLNYYNRLKDVLHKAYHDEDVREQRPTCHIKYRETYQDLPDIELLEAREISEIRASIFDVLRCFILRFITAGNDGVFSVYIRHEDFAGRTIELGSRINRIIRNACLSPAVRDHLGKRWKAWLNSASPTHMAVLYSAIRQTLDRFPQVQHARAEAARPRPIFNCYRRLLRLTRQQLATTPEGVEWLKVLYREDDPSDAGYAQWLAQYEAVSRDIREKCLREASEKLPLYQIHEARIGEIRRPGT